jgi:hypothetical protein
MRGMSKLKTFERADEEGGGRNLEIGSTSLHF